MQGMKPERGPEASLVQAPRVVGEDAEVQGEQSANGHTNGWGLGPHTGPSV